MHHIEIVTMRVWKELVRADGEGVTRELPEFQRGDYTEDSVLRMRGEGLLRCWPW